MWGKIADDEAIELIRHIEDPTKMAEILSNASLKKGTRDNVAVVVWIGASCLLLIVVLSSSLFFCLGVECVFLRFVSVLCV